MMDNSSSGGGISITRSLKDALLDLYFKQTCEQQGWAYLPSKDITTADQNTVLVFFKGSQKIRVKVHAQLIAEIKSTAEVFDYLVCKVGHSIPNDKDKSYDDRIIVVNPLALTWIKTKNGKNFSDRQLDQMTKITPSVAVFNIRDILAPPAKLEIRLETKTGKDWLDEIDEKREEAESDDDYF